MFQPGTTWELIAVYAGLLLAGAGANAGLVFEADFNGPGTGTGGTNNIATLGATAGLPTFTGGSATVANSNPISTFMGGYLSTSSTNASGYVKICNFTPNSPASSLDALYGTQINGFTAINGAFDVYVRCDAAPASNASAWCHLLDADNRSAGGLRLIMHGVVGSTTGSLQWELNCNSSCYSNAHFGSGPAGVGSYGGSSTNTMSIVSGGSGVSGIQPGQTRHLGFTFNTDVNGLVTWRIFGASGTNNIDTSATSTNLIAYQTFNVAAFVGTNLLPGGAWSLQELGNGYTNALCYDGVRLFSSDPGTFYLPAHVQPTFSGLTVPPILFSGATSVVLSGKVSNGGTYPAQGETISVTINVNLQTTTISDATGDFTINYNLSGLPVGGAPYPISYGYNGDASLSAASDASTALYLFPTASQIQSPFILKVSDAVVPGQSFSVNGEWLYLFSNSLAIAPDTTGSSPASPPPSALYPLILQSDKDAHFVVARMPAGAAPGVYNLWVSNAVGWSACYKLNAARALYMSDYEAFNGSSIEVVGRNFAQGEFGGAGTAMARLNPTTGGATYTLPVKDVNPYHLTCTVGNQPLGTYYVEVSSDNGLNWSRLASGQTLAVQAVPPGNYDPLGLGVSWARYFNWSKVYNVTNYGVLTNSLSDQSAAVQSVMNTAENNGGGVVYFPNGSYYLHQLNIGADVVLEGQDEYSTKLLYYTATNGGNSFILSKGTGSLGGIPQLQGVANLSLLLANNGTNSLTPWAFINLGDYLLGPPHNINLRTANRMFIADVNISYPTGIPTTNAGTAIQWTGVERVLVKDNHFSGWAACVLSSYLTQYYMLKHNYFEYASGYIHDTANYLFDENNYAKIHGEYAQQTHGYFGRAWTYMANNYVEGSGDYSNVQNDGEGFCVEDPNSYEVYGTVLAATATNLTVAPITNLATPVLYFGNLSVRITHGRGLGQLAQVASVNTNSDVLTLSQPLMVLPTTNSTFVLGEPLSYQTVYSNTMVNCAGSINCGEYDVVVADNTLIDASGFLLGGVRTWPDTYYSQYWQDSASSFLRLTRNSLNGVSRRYHSADLLIYNARFDGPNFFDILCYAPEITGNQIAGNNTLTLGAYGSAPYDGITLCSYGYSNLSDGIGTGDDTDAIIESNRLSNLPSGVNLTQSNYGNWVSQNSYDSSVPVFLSNATATGDNTLINANTSVSLVVPVITTQPQNKTVLSGDSPTFYVAATGGGLFYQWFTNGTAVGGLNGPSFTPTNVVLADNNLYCWVVVSNGVATATSSTASLTVSATPLTPAITNQPQSQSVGPGEVATFSVGATALPAPSYQWQTNGVNIPGAGAPSYTTWTLGTNNNGLSFTCVVANGAGSVISSPALLSVTTLNITMQSSPGRMILNWPYGTLQTATNLSGPWVDLPAATAPYTSAPSGGQQFFRVIQ